MKDKITLLIADDHEIVRQGIKLLLDSHPRIVVVGEAGDGSEAIDKIKELRPDVALLDISMPKLNGLQAANLIHTSHPDTKLIMFSMYDKEAYAHQALALGASGYLLKTSSGKEIIEAIEKACDGQYCFSPKINADIIKSYLDPQPPEAGIQSGYNRLSDREQQIFRLVAEGLSSKRIGQLLYISPRTVDKHRSNIMKKLEIADSRELVRYALKIGVLDPELWGEPQKLS
jgi:DNA-binding NarL/FixJ family response regulator